MPTPPPVNLPLPTHSCAFIVGAAQVGARPVSPDTLGALYAAAIRAQGIGDAPGQKITQWQLIEAFSDFLGCFTAPAKK